MPTATEKALGHWRALATTLFAGGFSVLTFLHDFMPWLASEYPSVKWIAATSSILGGIWKLAQTWQDAIRVKAEQ